MKHIISNQIIYIHGEIKNMKIIVEENIMKNGQRKNYQMVDMN